MIKWRENDTLMVTDIHEYKVYLNHKKGTEWELVCTPLGFYSYRIFGSREEVKTMAPLWIRRSLEGQLVATKAAIETIDATPITTSIHRIYDLLGVWKDD